MYPLGIIVSFNKKVISIGHLAMQLIRWVLANNLYYQILIQHSIPRPRFEQTFE